MPATTWLLDSELNQLTSNLELNDLLARVRKATGENWQIIEYQLTVGPWYKRSKKKMYSVYFEIMHPEFQVINFYREDTGTSMK